ncbi:MAG: protein kinase [Myxococcota bacterium]
MNYDALSDLDSARSEPFGRYILRERLGRGGMAEVFLAELPGPRGFAKSVVVKRLLPELTSTSRIVEMFLAEASIAARFSHSSLVPVFELVQAHGTYAIVMEYVEGFDLAVLLRRAFKASRKQLLDPAICLHLVSRAADALHYVHELRDDEEMPLGIVHRDISPKNLMISTSGNLKVLDFGVLDFARQASSRSGEVIGTRAYMAPEQMAGAVPSPAMDVFGLGVVLYEMLTVENLRGPEELEFGTFSHSKLEKPGFDEETRALLRSMLEVDPGRRIQSAGEVYDRLDRVLVRVGRPTANDVKEACQELLGGDDTEFASVARTSVTLGRGSTLKTPVQPPVAAARRTIRTAWTLSVAALVGIVIAVLFLRPALTENPSAIAPPVEPPTTRPPSRAPPAADHAQPPPDEQPQEESTAATSPKPPEQPEPRTPRRRKPTTRTLKVTSQPSSALYVGGRRRAKRTPAELSLPPGAHRLRFKDPSTGLDAVRTVTVTSSSPAQLNYEFTPGKLSIVVTPWAHVFMRGKKIGTTPMPAIALPEGEHALRLSNPDLGVEKTLRVKIRSGERLRRAVSLAQN